MDSREVNEIVVKLLAAVDKIGGRERDDVLHYVGRLSRAATRERAIAVDEMHYRDRKMRQLEAELRRVEPNNPRLSDNRFPLASQAQLPPHVSPSISIDGRYDYS